MLPRPHEPLTQLFRRTHENYNDFVGEDLPQVLGVLGPGASPTLVADLANSTNHPSARGAAAHSLKEIGVRHAEAREPCVAALAEQLRRYADQDPALNGFLIGYLLDLKGVEDLDAIRRAFDGDAVDEAIAGDWEDVQIELGLQAKGDRPRRLTQMQLQLRETFGLLEAADKRPQALPTSRVEARAERAVHESVPNSASKPRRRCTPARVAAISFVCRDRGAHAAHPWQAQPIARGRVGVTSADRRQPVTGSVVIAPAPEARRAGWRKGLGEAGLGVEVLVLALPSRVVGVAGD